MEGNVEVEIEAQVKTSLVGVAQVVQTSESVFTIVEAIKDSFPCGKCATVSRRMMSLGRAAPATDCASTAKDSSVTMRVRMTNCTLPFL